jgi:hypothetical protein
MKDLNTPAVVATAEADPADPLEGVDLVRFHGRLRPHTAEETLKLTESIAAEGCREKVLVGILEGSKYLVDGFHRRRVCQELALPFEASERHFGTEEEVLAWMEANGRARRNQTRTERNYDVGCRYLREKKTHGGDRTSAGSKGKKLALDNTAQTIAAQERCSHQHVKNCAGLARHVEEAVSCGLDFLKWPILEERITYSRKLLDDLISAGPGGCEGVEALLAANPEGPISPASIRKALGIKEKKQEAEGQPERSAVDFIAETFERAVKAADSIDDVNDLARLVDSAESNLARLRGILDNKRRKK